MLHKIALIPAVAAAFALAACHPKGPEVSRNDVNAGVSNVAVETNAADNGASANAAATSNGTAPQSNASGSPTGGPCAGITGQKCASDKDFCKLPDGQCRVADAQGTCTTKPQACGRIYRPVCGCDGKTYGNVCEASHNGVSVQSQGECPKG
jgi:hypothetical protein